MKLRYTGVEKSAYAQERELKKLLVFFLSRRIFCSRKRNLFVEYHRERDAGRVGGGRDLNGCAEAT